MLRPLGKGMRIALIGLLATACAPRTQYIGLDLRPGSAIASDVRALAERARSGDKQAQYELGIAFEEGRLGLRPDVKRAAKLYAAAAMDKGGTRTAFVPNNGAVSAVTLHSGPLVPGLKSAKERLVALGPNQINWFELTSKVISKKIPLEKFPPGIYPGLYDEYDCTKSMSFKKIVNEYTGGYVVSPPLFCVYPERIEEISKLSYRGDVSAQITLLAISLSLDLEKCSFDFRLKKLLDLSEAGRGDASIISGNVYRECSENVSALQRYHLAKSQNMMSADQYIYSIEPKLPPISELIK